LDKNKGICRTCVALDNLQANLIERRKMEPQLLPPNIAPAPAPEPEKKKPQPNTEVFLDVAREIANRQLLPSDR
jgi:hypothetical protein